MTISAFQKLNIHWFLIIRLLKDTGVTDPKKMGQHTFFRTPPLPTNKNDFWTIGKKKNYLVKLYIM